jgi:hypothetical protein
MWHVWGRRDKRVGYIGWEITLFNFNLHYVTVFIDQSSSSKAKGYSAGKGTYRIWW